MVTKLVSLNLDDELIDYIDKLRNIETNGIIITATRTNVIAGIIRAHMNDKQ